MSCNICMEEHEDDHLIKTCHGKHIFCKKCFEDWKEECSKTSTITICPLCRTSNDPFTQTLAILRISFIDSIRI